MKCLIVCFLAILACAFAMPADQTPPNLISTAMNGIFTPMKQFSTLLNGLPFGSSASNVFGEAIDGASTMANGFGRMMMSPFGFLSGISGRNGANGANDPLSGGLGALFAPFQSMTQGLTGIPQSIANQGQGALSGMSQFLNPATIQTRLQTLFQQYPQLQAQYQQNPPDFIKQYFPSLGQAAQGAMNSASGIPNYLSNTAGQLTRTGQNAFNNAAQVPQSAIDAVQGLASQPDSSQ